MEEKKNLEQEQMENVSGGGSGSYDPSYPNCPNCGSSQVQMLYEHDEIGVFRCDKCNHQFTKRYGE